MLCFDLCDFTIKSHAKMSFLSRIFEPNPSLNYGFIAAAYALLSILAVALGTMQLYDVGNAHGYWLIPAPCVPALLYMLILWWRQKSVSTQVSTGSDSKKDK